MFFFLLVQGVEPRWKGLNTAIPVVMVSKRAYRYDTIKFAMCGHFVRLFSVICSLTYDTLQPSVQSHLFNLILQCLLFILILMVKL